jgi:1-acyl-sn-glycerol-3-phosphate acyltransferase
MNAVNAVLSALLWLVGVIHFLLVASVVGAALLVLPARRIFPLARLACRMQLLVMGCPLEVVHTVPLSRDTAYLFVGNHESLFDVFAIGAALPGHAIGLEAEPHFRYPVWGRITRAWGNLPLPEGRIGEARKALERAAEVLRGTTHVVILPEGHRTRTGRLGPLKKGAFHLAHATRATICPFVQQGLYELHNTHSWRLRPRRLRVIFGAPLTWREYADDSPEQLRERVRALLEALDGSSDVGGTGTLTR